MHSTESKTQIGKNFRMGSVLRNPTIDSISQVAKRILRATALAACVAATVASPAHCATLQTPQGWIRSKYGFETKDAVHVDAFPNTNEQVGVSLTKNTADLDYVITAGTQTDRYGYGNAYLLNGVTDKNYWYQIGIDFHAPGMDEQGPLYFPGFQVVFNVFGPDRQPILLQSNRAGMLDFDGKINPQDKVELRLHFENGYVVMDVHDLDSGAQATVGYDAMGATYFAGTKNSLNQNGFFTGPMLERYSVSDGTTQRFSPETYIPRSPISSPVWIWTDLYNLGNQAKGVYSFTTNTTVSPADIAPQTPLSYSFPKSASHVQVNYSKDGTIVIE